VLGAYVAAVRIPAILAERRLKARLREVSDTAPLQSDTPLLMQRQEGPLPGLDRIAGGTRAGEGLSRLIEQSGVRTTPSAVLVLSGISGVIVACAVGMMVARPLVMVAAGVAGLALPTLWLMRRRTVRLQRFEEQFPEALDLLSRAIRAGHAFQTAMGMVAEELPPPVGAEFRKTFDRQNFGMPLREAMDEMADRVDLLDVRFFVTAVAIQRETGGNLAEILDNLARVVRERFKIRRQVRVHTAHGRFTGYVLLALPAALAMALMFISPEHMKLLFEQRMGQMMVLSAMVLQTIGFVWIRQVIKIEV
jgi:tight adherence protein B